MPGYLQSYVLPVCVYEEHSNSAFVHQCVGTGFLINTVGFFLTARHVIEQAVAIADQKKLRLGIVGKAVSGQSPKSMVAPLTALEFAPDPFDIALGLSKYFAPTHLKLESFDINVWQDVATYGYPISAASGPPEHMRINLRALKGYVQRITGPEDIPMGIHPNGFELSFNINPGMSGAPIFVYRGGDDLLIGVAVSSFRGETLESEISEVDDNGTRFSEKRLRIEEFGFGHDIRGVLDWRPKMAQNQTLMELSAIR